MNTPTETPTPRPHHDRDDSSSGHQDTPPNPDLASVRWTNSRPTSAIEATAVAGLVDQAFIAGYAAGRLAASAAIERHCDRLQIIWEALPAADRSSEKVFNDYLDDIFDVGTIAAGRTL
jgi:hypothetical protein